MVVVVVVVMKSLGVTRDDGIGTGMKEVVNKGVAANHARAADRWRRPNISTSCCQSKGAKVVDDQECCKPVAHDA